MNSVYRTYSNVYNVALMHRANFEGGAAVAKDATHVRRTSLFGRLIGR
jgi:hypothetical protein